MWLLHKYKTESCFDKNRYTKSIYLYRMSHRMTERKFTRGLIKNGTAAQMRETVSHVVRERAALKMTGVVEPIDFEDFVTKHKTIIENDPQRELLIYPNDDISELIMPQKKRKCTNLNSVTNATGYTTNINREDSYSNPVQVQKLQNIFPANDCTMLASPTASFTIPLELHNSTQSENDNIEYINDKYGLEGVSGVECTRLTRQALHTYTAKNHLIYYKYTAYGGTCADLPKSSPPQADSVAKQGYLLKGPVSVSDRIFANIGNKSFKRRYCFLRREVDGTYILELHKDEKPAEAKTTIVMEFCTEVIQNSKCGRYCFELRMTGHKSFIFAAENENDFEDWFNKVSLVVQQNRIQEERRLESFERTSPRSASTITFSTLKDLDQTMKILLIKYTKETDISIAQARLENRQRLFTGYQLKSEVISNDNIEPNRDIYGKQILLVCRSLNFRLNSSVDVADEENIGQVEPYITSLALYDAREGRKLTESFYFNINDDHVHSMLPDTPVPSWMSGSNVPKQDERDEKISDDSCFQFRIFDTVAPDSVTCTKERFRHLKQGIFSISSPHVDIFAVIKIEKILQGPIVQSTEPYIKASRDPKIALKVHKTVRNYAQHIGHFRQPFAWAAKPLFRPCNSELDVEHGEFEFTTIYRQELHKLKDEDLLKLLADFKKPEKQNKLTVIPGYIRLHIEEIGNLAYSCNTSVVTQSYFINSGKLPTIEVREFQSNCERNKNPYTAFRNHLYVYPLSLQFDSQKLFSRARNITVVVELRDSDEMNSQPLKCIYGRPGQEFLVTQLACPVWHHNTCPTWYEEIKMRLPLGLLPEHHLLFSFYHVSCNLNKKRDNLAAYESLIGYAWLPLLQRGKIHLEERKLPVASTLPVGYLSLQPLGLGKKNCAPVIQWIDGQRSIFALSLRMDSTILTADQHLHNLFAHSERLLEGSKFLTLPTETETCKILKAAHAIDISGLIDFLPTILNELFTLLVYTQSEEVGLNIVRLLINIIHIIADEADRKDLLSTYIKFVFHAPYYGLKTMRTVHGELCKYLPTILHPKNTDFLVVNKFMRYSNILFDFISKSMGQHLLTTGRIRMLRNERFPKDFENDFETLFNIVSLYVLKRYKDLPKETQQLNNSLSSLVRRCLTYMNRGFVYKLIREYMEKHAPGDPYLLQKLKWNFLRDICLHEHYVPLNLPLDSNFKNCSRGILQQFTLSEAFCSQHFLSGLLLQELKYSLYEVRDVRCYALTIFKNQLAKHELDDRYQGRGQLARISLLYVPWLRIVIDNLKHINDMTEISTLTALFSTDSVSRSSSYNLTKDAVSETSSPRSKNRRNFDNPSHFSVHLESKYLAAIAGQAISNGISDTSINSITSDLQACQNVVTKNAIINKNYETDVAFRNGHNRSISVTEHIQLQHGDKCGAAENKDLLFGVLFVIKYISQEHMISWWENCNESEVLSFLIVLDLCLINFRYVDKKYMNHNTETKSSHSKNINTLPAVAVQSCLGKNDSTSETKPLMLQNHENFIDETVCEEMALIEANITTEIGMIILDCLGLYVAQFREKLYESLILPKIAGIYMRFLQLGQSETLSKHLFAALRAFINNFSTALFKGNSILCGEIVYELLKACDNRLALIRHESCAVLYLLMRSNFEFCGRKGLTRVHLQVIISVSQMIGIVLGLNNARFQESLSLINSYASNDKAMEGSGFDIEVKDLTRRVRTVLMATAQIQAHQTDPEKLLELQHSLANSYASTPELRHTWLNTMARNHELNGSISEAACCHLHIAALMTEYIRLRGGCAVNWSALAFSKISRNIARDEQGLKLDTGAQDSQYTEQMLLEQLKNCADFLYRAERFECMGELYKLILPFYERSRNYIELAQSYEYLMQSYNKILEVNRSGKRMLGRFYRVVFYGTMYFEEDHGIEYVYKEPKLTSLSEISERLTVQYNAKFGANVVKIIMDSSPVDTNGLDPKLAYIQVTHVIPFFSKDELDQRMNEFEQSHDVDTFMYETPFTKSGTARGSVEYQWKRKTVIKTSYSFPYLLKRIPVESRDVIELSPIEVAIDEMQKKVSELEEVILPPADVKKLQLRLQGSIAVTVNAGPLTYARTFLDSEVVDNFSLDRVEDLKDLFRDLIGVCHTALQLNSRIINNDQKEYHYVLEENYRKLCQELSKILDEPLKPVGGNRVNAYRKNMALLNAIK